MEEQNKQPIEKASGEQNQDIMNTVGEHSHLTSTPIDVHLRYTTKIEKKDIEVYNPLRTFSQEHKLQGRSFSYRMDTRYDYYKRLNRLYRQAVNIQEIEQAQLAYNVVEEALTSTVQIYRSSDRNHPITIAEAKSQLIEGEQEVLVRLEQLEQTYSTPMSDEILKKLLTIINQANSNSTLEDPIKQVLRELNREYKSDTLATNYSLFVEDLITHGIIKDVK